MCLSKMVIMVDSREQNPLSFSHPFVEGLEVGKLQVGDYQAKFKDGYLPPIIFERKSLQDLFGTLSAGYKRFKRECNRAIESKITLIIIIEASLTKISHGFERSSRNPEEIIKQLFTLYIKHGIPFVCCNTREESALYITNFYIAIGKEYIRKRTCH